MSDVSVSQLYQDHYDTLHTEDARVAFLLNLKRMGSADSMAAFDILVVRWKNEPYIE